MMSIRAPCWHKIAEWTDRKSKMDATASILKKSIFDVSSQTFDLFERIETS